MLRKLLLIAFVAAGAMVGLVSALDDGGSTQTVMSSIGALFGLAIGGALLRVGHQRPLHWYRDPIPGMGMTSEDLAANYWRDKGHPPFMKPPEDAADRVLRH